MFPRLLCRERYYWNSDSCQRSHRRQVSPLASCHLPVVPSSITWYATSPLYPPPQCDASLPGFATLVQARRYTPPKQVRHRKDRQFVSGYSPPRLTTTQLPSTPERWQTRRPRGSIASFSQPKSAVCSARFRLIQRSGNDEFDDQPI